MSDQPDNGSITATIPLISGTNGTTTVTSSAPVVQTPTETDEQNPKWLAPRLQRARTEAVTDFLKELGIEEEQLKGVKLSELIKAEQERRDAAKTDLQRAQEALEAAQPKITGYDTLFKAFKDIVDAEIQAIPESHRERANSLLKIAGDDPVLQMQVIRELKPLFGSDEAKSTKQAERKIDGGAGAATSGRKGTEPAPADALRERFRIGR